MATTDSVDSNSVEPTGSVFLVATTNSSDSSWLRLAQIFNGTLTAPPRFVQSPDGALVTNPSASIFDQQDNLLTSWLLSTISSSFLSSFTDVQTAGDVWIMANNLFAADTTAKQSQLRHELHSLQKGNLSIRLYVDKIKALCALLAASGSPISEAERTAVLLAGLSSEFEAIVSHASLSPVSLPFQRLVDALIECEARQILSVQDVLVAANVVEGTQFRFGHLVQQCYYRYHLDGQSSLEAQAPNGCHGGFEFGENRGELEPKNRIPEYSQNWGFPGQNWRPPIQPNECFNNLTSRGPPASYKNNRFNLFTQYGNGQNDVAGPNLNFGSYGRNDFGIGRRSFGPQFGGDSLGHPFGGPTSRPVGLTVHETPWRTKPPACVFSVDSSLYDSSQFVGIPSKLPELHASDYSDATTFDSNFNTTDSYVPLPVESTSWCPDSRATHNVCRDTSDLYDSTLYSGKSSLLMGNGVSTDILSIGSADIQTREMLMRGQVRDGLYHFSAGSDSLLSSVPNAALHSFYLGLLDKSKISSFRVFWSVSEDANQGIIHRVSCPHTSKQNGVAERKHRHVVETGLTVLAQANLPIDYWGYVFCSAMHLINRLPTSVLDGKTPFQSLFGRAPTYNHLRSVAHKGYFCLTPDEKVIVSRHVVFDENRFLFLLSPTSAKLPLNTTTYVPVVQFIVSDEVRLDPISATEDSINSPIHNGDRTQHDSSDMYSASQHSSHSRPAIQEEVPSTVTFPTEPPTIPLVSTTNNHAMVTRSKAGIFKSKALCADKVEAEPCSVEEALAHPDWQLAVQVEFDALLANSTWELCPLPPGRKTIGCKWLFRIKKNPNGTINRRKELLVAKRCSQVPGYNCKETFSPVVKPTTIRTILSIAVTNGWSLRQVDVNNAFLNGDLTDEVFMQQPPSYEQSGPNDASLFVRSSSNHTLYVLVYVGDIVITGNSFDVINCFVQQLYNKFALKDMGELHYFLGIEVSRSSSCSLHLCQRKYIRELLAQSSMINAKSVHTPMVNSSLLSKDEGEPLADPTKYRSIAGALQYIVLTLPDIAYAVNRVDLIGCLWLVMPMQIRDLILMIVEAEYQSLAAAASDVTWLVSLLTELNLQSVDLPTVWCDNSSVVAVAANPILHSKFKHVELDLFFIREKMASGEWLLAKFLHVTK
ncbi:hypothetical protein CXB51_032333 [Gossypium anomalum]|uniref:Reverse transcriptase Ty1/copia-type domain-containing protein n=1 Tax=Gossypium anomalum TaxID=47600 RepID=A0A8J6CK88_9ROSI|nr:hypothetical protein CXB51_032333 [Gossypium anomalum]